MSRQKGSIGISNNIEVRASAPLDARYICETTADMINPNSYDYYYIGMPVYNRQEQKMYTLRYPDPTNIDNWATVGSGKDGRNGLDARISGTEKVGRENIITFVWVDEHGSDQYTELTVLDGAKGEPGIGLPGPQGPAGTSFSILSAYDTYEELIADHPIGNKGDAYFIGGDDITAPDLYIWDVEKSEWHNNGKLSGIEGKQGSKGDAGFSPEVVVAETGPQIYKLRITTASDSFITPNLKGIDGDNAPQAILDDSTNAVQSLTIKAAIDVKQNKQLSSPITIGEITATTVEDALTALNEKAVDVDDTLDITSDNPISNKASTTELNKKQNKILTTPMDIGGTTATTVEDALNALNNKTVDVDSEISSTSKNPLENKAVKTELDKKVDKTKVGVANGVAELDAEGKVPASQLPSFVDDVKECYYDPDTEKMYENKDVTDPEHPIYSDEITPESGKIYIDKDGNDSYRWTGSMYASVGSANALTLGETSATAYRGDRGKIAYDDSQTNKTNIGIMTNLATTDKSNLVSAVNEIKTEVGNKVDKVTGKGLSTNDYDNTEKAEVAKVKDKQNKNLSTPVTVGNEQKSTVETAIVALAELSTYNAGSKLNAIAIADIFSAEEEYEIDDYVIYDTKLYKAIAQHSGAWDDADFEEKQVMSEIIAAAVSDYDSLQNKPQIAGITLSGNKTYSQLGIQQSEQGKGLSTNDYDDAAKAIVDGITSALSDKVDKVTGKGLSTNDYNNDEKTKVTNATTHLSKVVTNEDGVHGFKVTPVTEDEDKIYYKNGNSWKEIQLGSVTQLEEMPAPVAKYSGKIYQYVGVTNDNYKKGYFYECVNAAGVYAWQAVRVQSGGGQTIQYDPLPTAEATLVGSLLQYVGTTNANYKRGHFYECVAGETTGTFVWKEVTVDTLTFSDEDIDDIEEAFDNAFTA